MKEELWKQWWIFRIVRWDKRILKKFCDRAVGMTLSNTTMTFSGIRIFSGVYLGFLDTRCSYKDNN